MRDDDVIETGVIDLMEELRKWLDAEHARGREVLDAIDAAAEANPNVVIEHPFGIAGGPASLLPPAVVSGRSNE